MRLEGDLEDVGLTGLIDLMSSQRQTGAVVLERGGEKGLLYFAGGEIVDAAAGRMRGQEAVYQLLAWDAGQFRIRDEVHPPGRSIWASRGELLLEAMRKLDEGKYQDQTEDDLVTLMSNLEQIQVRLRDAKTRSRPQRALGLCAELVNRTAEFWESLAQDGEGVVLPSLVAAAAARHPLAGQLSVAGNRLTLAPLHDLQGALAASPESSRTETSRTALGEVLLDILEAGLGRIVGRFRDPDLRTDWGQTCTVFVAELRATLAEVEF